MPDTWLGGAGGGVRVPGRVVGYGYWYGYWPYPGTGPCPSPVLAFALALLLAFALALYWPGTSLAWYPTGLVPHWPGTGFTSPGCSHVGHVENSHFVKKWSFLHFRVKNSDFHDFPWFFRDLSEKQSFPRDVLENRSFPAGFETGKTCSSVACVENRKNCRKCHFNLGENVKSYQETVSMYRKPHNEAIFENMRKHEPDPYSLPLTHN